MSNEKQKQKLELEAMEGHEHQTVSRLAAWVFCILFIFIIYFIPLIQAQYEKKTENRIQALDLPVDVLWSFSKRSHTTDSLKSILVDQLDVLKENLSKTNTDGNDFSQSEDLISVLQNKIYRNWQSANRNLQLDSSSAPTTLLLSDSLLTDLRTKIINNEDKASLVPIVERIQTLLSSKEYNKITPRGFSGLMNSVFKQTLFSQKYLRKYEEELEDKSLATIYTRPLMQFTRYALFEDAGEKVVVGKNGWYFYKFGVDYLVRPYMNDPRSFIVDYNDVALTESPISAIEKFRDQLKQKGIELLVVVIPGKASIYPEMINARMKEVKEPFSHSLKAIEEIRKLNIPVVDLFNPFYEARKLDAENKDSLYLRMDTHWKLRALKIAASEIAKEVRSYDWFSDTDAARVEYVIKDTVVERDGDVGVMSQIPNITFRQSKMSFPSEKTKCEQVYRVYRDSTGKEIRRSLFNDDFRDSRILILGDSFSRIYQTDSPRSAGWISHLAKELEEPLGSIVSDGGASTLVRQTLARRSSVLSKKKLVIWEFVERDFRYGAEGWKDVDL